LIVRFGDGEVGSDATGTAAGKASSVTQFASARANLASNADVHFSNADFEQSR